MTEKQQQVLDQVHQLLQEHFDACVYVVDMADVEDTSDHQTVGGFTGGMAMAMGLCYYQIEYLKKRIRQPMPDDE